MKHKKIIVVASVVVVTGILVLGIVAILGIYRLFSNPLFAYDRPMPPQLEQPRVIVGDSILSRAQFLRLNSSFLQTLRERGIGSINDIAVGELDSHPGPEVAIAAEAGAIVLDRNGVKQSEVKFEFETVTTKVGPFRTTHISSLLGDVRVIDIENDGVCEFLARGSTDGAAVFDHQGKRLWSYGKHTKGKSSVRDMVAGDLNGDGVAEFVVSWDGIEAFDRNGKRLWQQPEKYEPSQIEIVDIDGTGRKKIVSIGGDLEIRDGTGTKGESIDPPTIYVGKFSLCYDPETNQNSILTVEDGYLWLLNFKGEGIAHFAAPLSDFPEVVEKTPYGEFGTSVYKAKGVWARLFEDQQRYLAVVTEFSGLSRSVLYVYTTTGKLVYQEVLPEACSSIAVLSPESKAGSDKLLVGGSQTVWRYKAK